MLLVFLKSSSWLGGIADWLWDQVLSLKSATSICLCLYTMLSSPKFGPNGFGSWQQEDGFTGPPGS